MRISLVTMLLCLWAGSPATAATIIDFSTDDNGDPFGFSPGFTDTFDLRGLRFDFSDKSVVVFTGNNSGDKYLTWASHAATSLTITAVNGGFFSVDSFEIANSTFQQASGSFFTTITTNSGSFSQSVTPFVDPLDWTLVSNSSLANITSLSFETGTTGALALDNIEFTVATVPEPSSYALCLLTAAGLAVGRKRRKRT